VIIGVLNGPNLNLLGTREPAVYGTATLTDIIAHLERVGAELGVQVCAAQANGEGQRDAFTATSLPFVEVHLSNIHAREPERRHSVLASASIGMVCGLGADGYEYGLRGLVRALAARHA
jgi:3-dehydroquinate dehydratase-2